jgi:hypothetical protein
MAFVTDYKNWKMSRRYTYLKPKSLHALAALRGLAVVGAKAQNDLK